MSIAETQTYNIIVAKYAENLDWINFMDKSKIIIYNKSTEYLENAFSRPNIGRDPETFLHHIITYYDNLPAYIILVQGDPFPHMYVKNPELFQEQIDMLLGSNINDVKPLFTGIHLECHNTFPSIKTKEYYSLFFEGDIPNQTTFAAGCQYIIPKESILCRPLKFYIKILKMIHNSPITDVTNSCYGEHLFDSNSIDPWCVERLLMFMFSKDITISDKFLLDSVL